MAGRSGGLACWRGAARLTAVLRGSCCVARVRRTGQRSRPRPRLKCGCGGRGSPGGAAVEPEAPKAPRDLLYVYKLPHFANKRGRPRARRQAKHLVPATELHRSGSSAFALRLAAVGPCFAHLRASRSRARSLPCRQCTGQDGTERRSRFRGFSDFLPTAIALLDIRAR